MGKPLSRGQRKVLAYIIEHINQHSWAPTLIELGEHFGWKSSNTASAHLLALAKKGAIERPPRSARAIRVTDAGREALR